MTTVDWLLQTLTSCWGSISLVKEWVPMGLTSEEIEIENRRFRVLRLLGEGGYSFVYLVREVALPGLASAAETEYALKKVQAATGEQLAAAKREMDVMVRLKHTNLLPLLASAVVPAEDDEGSLRYTAYMLFPLYRDGSVWDVVTALAGRGEAWPARTCLEVLLQVCRGVAAMHGMQPPLAHRDLKPQNILLQRLPDKGPAGPDTGLGSPGLLARPPGGRRGCGWKAVVMDFGSTRVSRVEVAGRVDALHLQEEAEAHSTAPYRAPELFDVPSRGTIDERTDVWSLGCILYFMMYGVSPFERVLNESGGSLSLAVINGHVKFPDPDPHPEELRTLVLFCLNTDPATRPYVEEVISQINVLLEEVS